MIKTKQNYKVIFQLKNFLIFKYYKNLIIVKMGNN